MPLRRLLHLVLGAAAGLAVVASTPEKCTQECTTEPLQGCDFVSDETADASDRICADPQASSPSSNVLMPSNINAVLHERYDELDDEFSTHLAPVLERAPFMQFPHARTVFKQHLLGTFSILGAWSQPRDVMRCGLFHTAYSGELFQFFVFNAGLEADRAELRGHIGEDAEQLTYLFGTVYRGKLNQTLVAEQHILTDEGLSTAHRFEDDLRLDGRDIAKILIVTIADYLDQMVEVNAWRDHHQISSPLSLYPGEMKPTIALYWFSSMCKAIRSHLDVVPPIFDHCTSLLSLEDEITARDAYWRVILEEADLSLEAQEALLMTAAERNPFVGEPLLMLGQLCYRQGRFAEAAAHARTALTQFYTLASAWDKRLPYAQWVAFTRLLLLRSQRKLEGHTVSLPHAGVGETMGNHLTLVDVRDLVEAMELF